jgi:hypothetical protein
LILDYDWVKHVIGSYAHLSPVLGCKIGQFSAINTHPNQNFQIWNN